MTLHLAEEEEEETDNVEEGWERIQCGVWDVNDGVIRDVRV